MAKKARWYEVSHRIAEMIWKEVDSLSDKDLAALAEAVNKRTQTNCWHLVYDAAPFLSQVAADVIRYQRTTDDAATHSAGGE